jgi:hypothetical protein
MLRTSFSELNNYKGTHSDQHIMCPTSISSQCARNSNPGSSTLEQAVGTRTIFQHNGRNTCRDTMRNDLKRLHINGPKLRADNASSHFRENYYCVTAVAHVAGTCNSSKLCLAQIYFLLCSESGRVGLLHPRATPATYAMQLLVQRRILQSTCPMPFGQNISSQNFRTNSDPP